MTVYAKYDPETMSVIGWYPDTVFSSPPQPHIPVSDEEHKSFVQLTSDSSKIARVEDGKIVIRNRVIESTWDSIRNKRDKLLKESDYTQMPDYSHPQKEAYAQYRQALRDIPQKYEYPSSVVWPKIEDYL